MQGRLARIGLCIALLAGCGAPGQGTPAVVSPSSAAVGSPAPSSSSEPTAEAAPTPRPSPTRAPTPAPTPATAVPCPGSDDTPRAAPRGETRFTSPIWAGYGIELTKPSITCVEGTWSQPRPRCALNADDAVFVGIGLDSFEGGSNLMLGVESYCSGGERMVVRGWTFEGEKLGTIRLEGARVVADDRIWARISFEDGTFVAQVVNLTNGTSAIGRTTLSTIDRKVAVWVVSTLNTCAAACRQVDLANFDTLTFLNAMVTINDTYRAGIRDNRWDRFRMALVPEDDVIARAGALQSDTAFEITWLGY